MKLSKLLTISLASITLLGTATITNPTVEAKSHRVAKHHKRRVVRRHKRRVVKRHKKQPFYSFKNNTLVSTLRNDKGSMKLQRAESNLGKYMLVYGTYSNKSKKPRSAYSYYTGVFSRDHNNSIYVLNSKLANRLYKNKKNYQIKNFLYKYFEDNPNILGHLLNSKSDVPLLISQDKKLFNDSFKKTKPGKSSKFLLILQFDDDINPDDVIFTYPDNSRIGGQFRSQIIHFI